MLPTGNDVTGKPDSKAYPVPDERIMVLSHLDIFVLFISSGKGHETRRMSWPFQKIKVFVRNWFEFSVSKV